MTRCALSRPRPRSGGVRAAASLALVLTAVLLVGPRATWAQPAPAPTPEIGGPVVAPQATLVLRQQATGTSTFTPMPPDPTLTPVPTSVVPSATPTLGAATQVPEVPNEERPIIVVDSFSTDPGQPMAGTVFTLHLRIANRGEHFAENIQASLSSDAFLAADQGSIVFWNSLSEGDKSTKDIRLRVADGLKNGVYPLSIALRWDDSYGSTYNDTSSIGIPVGAQPGRPLVVVTGSQLPARVAPGVPFSVQLDVLNAGGQEARNLVVVPTTGPLSLVGSGGSTPLTLGPGGTGSTVLRLMAAAPTQPGATSQPLELRYDDPDGERYTDTTTVGVLVTADAAYGPLPMVASYKVDSGDATGDTVRPGQIFLLHFDVRNVGAGAAYNTRMVLGGSLAAAGAGQASGLGPFAPVGTSNAVYIGDLAAGSSTTVDQRMVADGAADPGVYTISVSMEYMDRDGVAQQHAEVVTVLVSRPVELTIRPLDAITTTVVGQALDWGVEIINSGEGTLRVGEAEIVGSRYMDVQNGSRYVGPLDSGSQDVLEAILVPKAPGTSTVRVVVHYADDFNQQQVYEEPFQLEVTEQPEQPEAPPEEPGSGSLVMRVLKGLLGLGASAPSPPAAPTPASPGGALIEPASAP